MSADPISDEARLYALEVFVTKLYSISFALTPDPVRMFKLHSDAMLDDTVTFPGMDPARSDHTAAEVRNASKRLLDMVRTMMAGAGIEVSP